MTTEWFPQLQISRLEGRAQSVRLRQSLFHSLHSALTSSESTIKQAIAADTSNNDADIALEFFLALSELRTHYESLDLDAEVKLAHTLENLTGTTNVGIVYVIPGQRNLFYSVLSPLCAALAAGNCVILEVRPITESFISEPFSLKMSALATSHLVPSLEHPAQAATGGTGRRHLLHQ